jgi:hypothetical protein
MLLLAARGVRLEEVRRLLRTDTKIPEKSSYYAWVLHLAAEMGHLEIVQWLLRNRVTECTSPYYTVLLWAAKKRCWKTVEWLVREGGADVTEESPWGDTVWSFLPSDPPEPLLKALLFIGGPPASSPLHASRPQLVAQGAQLRAALPQWPADQERLLHASAFGQAISVSALVQLVARLAQPSFEDAWELAERGCFSVLSPSAPPSIERARREHE